MPDARKSFIDATAGLNVTVRVLTMREMISLRDETRHENRLPAAIADERTHNPMARNTMKLSGKGQGGILKKPLCGSDSFPAYKICRKLAGFPADEICVKP